MNKREDALKEALQENEREVHRWQMFLKENEIAIENMTTFGKRLTVDVMVPIGKKAFMPGHLLHTNEVLVAHYQGYFSKCTTSKAKEICEFRIKMAKDHLKKLELEAELWHNKLEKPYAEGVVPSGEEREIIEEFNEETEKLWRQEHRTRLKQAKQNERKEREKGNQNFQDTKKTDEDIFKLLEEAELMEELERELDTLEIDEVNDGMLRKLVSGEMKLPAEKKRLAHDKESTNKANPVSPNIVKIKDLDKNRDSRTNNNVQPNQEILDSAKEQNINSEAEEEAEEETLSEEVTLIKQQAKYLNVEDQIGFYDYHIQIIKQKLQRLPLRTPNDLNEKMHFLSVLEHLHELLEEAVEILGTEELAAKEDDDEESEDRPDEKCISSNAEVTTENKSTEKRRISFALEDQTLEFRKHEAVTQMLPPKMEKQERDIIRLNDEENPKNESNFNKVQKLPNKQVQIQGRVEQNLKFVSENQSVQDFDLVEKILQSSQGTQRTLHIKFQHSLNQSHVSEENRNTIGNPADIYNLYTNAHKLPRPTLFVNSYEGEDQVKVPVMKEADRQSAFADSKSEFSNPLQAKSILKNKSAVDNENRNGERNAEKKQPKKNSTKTDDLLSAYSKVMNEVIEKPLTEPEPLPDGKFIDAHTPKKRISRFKQIRQGNSTT